MNTIAREPQDAPGTGASFDEPDVLKREIVALRSRLSGLSEATLRITEDLDLGTVLQGVIDGARSLTGARYGALLVLDTLGGIEDLITSGISPKEIAAIKAEPKVLGLLQYLNEVDGPLRLQSIASHPKSVGFPIGHPPMKTFLGTPVFHRGQRLGNIYLTEKADGEFTPEDEEVLAVFASHAATAIANGRSYRDALQLKASLEALVDTSPVGVLVFDAKTMDLLSLNEETRRIVRGVRPPGRTQPDILSVIVPCYPDGRQIPLEDTPTARAIRSGETVRAEEMLISLPDGQKVSTIVNATPVFSEDGEVVSCITTMQDMTPLERQERLRTEFIGMVSHELRTPLATIKGSAATVLGSRSSLNHSEMQYFFRIIDEQADRMNSLVRDLLDTAQIEAGTLSVNTGPVTVADLVEDARTGFLRGGATNVIEVDLPPDLPRVEADWQRMTQVLSNIFIFSSNRSPYGSTIKVSASTDDVYVSISVANEGKGMSAGDLHRLLSKFSSGPTGEESGQPTGEGLGLSICRGIVEAHGGRIWAESGVPGYGIQLTFTIPSARENNPVTIPALHGVPEGQVGRRECVLVVDDDPHILLHLRNTLREIGCVPVVANSWRKAVALMETDELHLVLLNPALYDGEDAGMIDDIRSFTGAPIIFVSEHANDADIARAFDIGADDHISKPFSPTELAARIRAVLRRQSATDRPQDRGTYRLGDLVINYPERRVTVAGQPVQLTSTEYDLLSYMSTYAGRVLSTDHLLEKVWGAGYEGDSQSVRTFIKNVRRKLGDDARNPAYIFTEPRVGYRMAKPGEETPGRTRKRGP